MKKILLTLCIGLSSLLGHFVPTMSAEFMQYSSKDANITINDEEKIGIGSGSVHVKDSGTRVTKKVSLTGVRKISASAIGKLFVRQCEDPNCIEELFIGVDKNILPHIMHNINGDVLELGIKDNVSISIDELEYTVTVKDIRGISNKDEVSTEVFVSNAGYLSVKSSGNSTITATINHAALLKIVINGHGNITVKGQSDKQEIRMSGTGSYDAKKLESSVAHISLSGVAKMYLNIIQKIKGKISGASSVIYNKKHAPEVNIKNTGAATIKQESW